jgi:DsbC/DsbD-like thiol-disulfide interchange protein
MVPFMKTKTPAKYFFQVVLAATLLIIPAAFHATPLPQSQPNIVVSGNLAADKAPRGRSAQAMVVMDIPSGFHVHSNKPLEKFLIPTQLQIEAPKGVRVGAVVYPRAVVRSLKFSKNKVAVYEGRATMRFNVTVPAAFGSDTAELKARLRYQACNDELCFAPQTREVSIPVRIK